MSLRLGQVLREERLAQKLSQEYVAEAAGLSAKTVRRAENQGLITAETLKAICSVLKISSDDIDRQAQKPAPVQNQLIPSPQHPFSVLKEYQALILLNLIIWPICLAMLLYSISTDYETANFWAIICWLNALFSTFMLSRDLRTSFKDLLRYNRFCDHYLDLHKALKNMRHTIDDHSLTAREASQRLSAQRTVFLETAILPSSTPDRTLQPLQLLDEDIQRGVSPRKFWHRYLVAQQAELRLLVQASPRLQQDLDLEIQQLRHVLITLG